MYFMSKVSVSLGEGWCLFGVGVRTTDMATLDSGLIVRTSDLAKRRALNITLGEATLNIDAFIAHLISQLGGGHLFRGHQLIERDRYMDMDWTKLGRLAKGIAPRPPTIGFMLGPLSVEKKIRKVTSRQARNTSNAEIIRPQEVRPLRIPDPHMIVET